VDGIATKLQQAQKDVVAALHWLRDQEAVVFHTGVWWSTGKIPSA
jgi:hypothetical protein